MEASLVDIFQLHSERHSLSAHHGGKAASDFPLIVAARPLGAFPLIMAAKLRPESGDYRPYYSDDVLMTILPHHDLSLERAEQKCEVAKRDGDTDGPPNDPDTKPVVTGAGIVDRQTVGRVERR